MISGRRAASNEAAVAEIGAKGGVVRSFAGDMADEESVRALVEETERAFGRVDICVANAGGTDGETAPLVEMDSAMWRRTVTANLDGVFFLYREVAKRMIAGGRGGSLIGISSVSSIRIVPSLHYSAAKGGLNAMTTSIAGQLGVHGIRANAILPGFIETPATAGVLATDAKREGVIGRIPMKRIGIPNDIAALALFLAGDDSTYITAQHFVVDGGFTQT